MPTMKSSHGKTVVRKPVMLEVALTLLLGLGFAFADPGFANPTPKFAYVANFCISSRDCSAGNVSVYTINSATGALREIAGSPFAAGSQPASVTVDPSGRFAYVANMTDYNCSGIACSDGNVSAYTINGATGALREIAGSPFAAGHEPYSVTVDPLGRFAYVANSGDNTVSAYTINGSTGALSAVSGSPFATGIGPLSVTVDPSGQFAYVANAADNTVSAYTIDSSTGAWRAVSGSPFAGLFYPYAVTVHPSGRFAYVVNGCSSSSCLKGTVSAFTINSSTGALIVIAGSPVAAGQISQSVTVDPSGRFAYVANHNDGTLSAYTINNSTGALSTIAGSPFAAGQGPQSVTVDPSGRFAYVADDCNFTRNCLASSVWGFNISSSTGALSAVSGSPFAAGNASTSVAIAGQAVTTSVLTLSPRPLAFGNLPINTSSAAQSVTVTNTSAKAVSITGIALRGTAPGQFAFTDDCGKSLAAYATCKLEAIFKPTTEGAKTAFLDVNGGGGGLRSVMLTGMGT
jgi:6-phosphogluconolactonase